MGVVLAEYLKQVGGEQCWQSGVIDCWQRAKQWKWRGGEGGAERVTSVGLQSGVVFWEGQTQDIGSIAASTFGIAPMSLITQAAYIYDATTSQMEFKGHCGEFQVGEVIIQNC